MTYVNNISSFDGEQTPIELSTLSPPVLQGFGHQMRSPGSLFNITFNPQFGQSNVQGLGFNPSAPIMPSMNFFNPIATSFNTDLPGSSAENPGVDSLALNNNTFTDLAGGTQTFMTIAGTGNPQTGAVSLNGSGMKAAIESLIPSSITAYQSATGESGSANTAAADGVNLDFNGDTSYINTSSGSGGVTHSFVRNLYERFKVGGTNLVPSSQDDILEFEAEAGSNVEITTGTDKIIVGEVAAPHGFGNLQTDGNTVSATQINDTVKFTNATTSPVVAATLAIDGNDTTSDIKFTMTPDPRAGFGTHLVKIISLATPDGGTDSTIGADYDRYSILAYSFNPDTGNANSGVSGFLHDYAANMLPTASDISSGAGLSNSDISRSPRRNGTILMAQRVSSTVWVTSEFPVIRVSCPE